MIPAWSSWSRLAPSMAETLSIRRAELTVMPHPLQVVWRLYVARAAAASPCCGGVSRGPRRRREVKERPCLAFVGDLQDRAGEDARVVALLRKLALRPGPLRRRWDLPRERPQQHVHRIMAVVAQRGLVIRDGFATGDLRLNVVDDVPGRWRVVHPAGGGAFARRLELHGKSVHRVDQRG